MAKDKNMRITTPDGEPAGNGLKRLAITLVVIAVIFYVGTFFALKTDGARGLVEGWVSKKVGSEVQVGSARLAFPFGVTMTDLISGDIAGGMSGINADEVTIKFLSGAGCTVRVRGAEVVLVRDDEGSWAPRFFNKLGDLPDTGVAGLSKVTEEVRDDYSIYVVGGVIKWLGDEGKQVVVDGVDFEMRPVKLPGRRMHYYKLKIFKFGSEGVRGPSGKDIVREWLADEDSSYVELAAEGEIHGPAELFEMQEMEIRDENQ